MHSGGSITHATVISLGFSPGVNIKKVISDHVLRYTIKKLGPKSCQVVPRPLGLAAAANSVAVEEVVLPYDELVDFQQDPQGSEQYLLTIPNVLDSLAWVHEPWVLHARQAVGMHFATTHPQMPP